MNVRSTYRAIIIRPIDSLVGLVKHEQPKMSLGHHTVVAGTTLKLDA